MTDYGNYAVVLRKLKDSTERALGSLSRHPHRLRWPALAGLRAPRWPGPSRRPPAADRSGQHFGRRPGRAHRPHDRERPAGPRNIIETW